MPVDLAPAAERVAVLADGVTDAHFDAATPCPGWTVATLLEHVVGLTGAFADAANKIPGPPPGEFTGLPDDWRDRLHTNLDVLVAAWREPAAWEGETTAGGVTMPASVMGLVALDELVLHGWDLATATGRPFAAEPEHVAACLQFVEPSAQPGQEAGREGLFGPVIPVADDAPELHRLLAMAGRDPAWKA